MNLYIIIDKLYSENGKYYYMKYGSKLLLESATVHKLSPADIKKHLKKGFELIDTKRPVKMLVKSFEVT
uniref:Uncharacterized protein n=1 Tax=Marseillevirus LCMAC202 TaxID=2506606 RepID=A0A481YX97_9VIRU|nr:MAG: hypothetical protein LCMAC202_00750 [Marseillevirus LCMAC202]